MTTPTTGPNRQAGAGIGAVLRAARSERGLSLTDLQTRTKIRAKYLAALEEERFAELPPYPFARGFLQAVAAELGIDAVPLVERLSVHMPLQETPPEDRMRRLDAAVKPALRPSRLRRIVTWAIAVAVVVAVVAGVSFYRQIREFVRSDAPAQSQSEPSAQGPVPSPGLPAEAPPTVPPASPQGAAPPTPQAAATPSPELAGPAAADGVTVAVVAEGLCWLRVIVDGQTTFEGRLTSGDTRRWQGRRSVRLRIGNAGALRVTVNGRSLGILGRPGQVVERTFEEERPR